MAPKLPSTSLEVVLSVVSTTTFATRPPCAASATHGVAITSLLLKDAAFQPLKWNVVSAVLAQPGSSVSVCSSKHSCSVSRASWNAGGCAKTVGPTATSSAKLQTRTERICRAGGRDEAERDKRAVSLRA